LIVSTQQKRSVEELILDLSDLSVLDMAKLKTALEDKWGVKAAAAAPMMMAAAPAAAAAAVAESTEFEVSLEAVPADKKIGIIKEIRAITGLGLKEAKEVAESVAEGPKVVKSPVSKQDAEDIAAKLKAAGGTVKVKGL
jgi:large subunit ribosomal protein L7/L12